LIENLTRFLIGFSVIGAAILLLAYAFFIKDMRKTATGLTACAVLLASLIGLQLCHWYFLDTGFALFTSRAYVVLLLLTPPAFYFFSREILLPDSRLARRDLLHLVPVLCVAFLPVNLVIPIALGIGAGYSIWCARVVFGLRRHVPRFKFEMFFFTFFALLAALVLMLAIVTPQIDAAVFYLSYANFTGVAFILVFAALVSFPDLLSDISAAAEATYATSTLKQVDIEQKLLHLQKLMSDDKLFENENLDLAMLAEAVDLSSHQLSELINSTFGYGFSRYLREQRVAEARKLIMADASTSILAISLMTGFRSQSNFYAAFREITGRSPGAFRNK
jgi:AraC-like DNA-binding protein